MLELNCQTSHAGQVRLFFFLKAPLQSCPLTNLLMATPSPTLALTRLSILCPVTAPSISPWAPFPHVRAYIHFSDLYMFLYFSGHWHHWIRWRQPAVCVSASSSQKNPNSSLSFTFIVLLTSHSKPAHNNCGTRSKRKYGTAYHIFKYLEWNVYPNLLSMFYLLTLTNMPWEELGRAG